MFKVGDKIVVNYKRFSHDVKNYKTTVLQLSLYGSNVSFKAPSKAEGNGGTAIIWSLGAPYITLDLSEYKYKKGDLVKITGEMISYGKFDHLPSTKGEEGEIITIMKEEKCARINGWWYDFGTFELVTEGAPSAPIASAEAPKEKPRKIINQLKAG